MALDLDNSIYKTDELVVREGRLIEAVVLPEVKKQGYVTVK